MHDGSDGSAGQRAGESDAGEWPLILVSVSYADAFGQYWARTFTRPLTAVGALPFLLAELETEEDRRAVLRRADGLLLAGGTDIEPRHFGETATEGLWPADPIRDRLELAITREAMEERVPVLGTCRGMQVINVARGGTLHLDLSLAPGAGDHPAGGVPRFMPLIEAEMSGEEATVDIPSHEIDVVPGTVLHEILGDRAVVNSYHHQAVRDLAPGTRATAYAPDGVIEAIECDDTPALAMGVQWELQVGWRTDPWGLGVFETFVRHARARARARQLA